jgi:hypothetical protein
MVGTGVWKDVAGCSRFGRILELTAAGLEGAGGSSVGRGERVCAPGGSSGAFMVGRASRGRAGVAWSGKYHGGYDGGQAGRGKDHGGARSGARAGGQGRLRSPSACVPPREGAAPGKGAPRATHRFWGRGRHRGG